MEREILLEELADIYEITQYDKLLCDTYYKIKGKEKIRHIPKFIIKRSRKKYRFKDNLARYFSHKYFGIPIGKFTTGYQQLSYRWAPLESIGAFCAIALNVNLTEGNHPTNYISIHQMLYQKMFNFCDQDRPEIIDSKKNGKVIIGNDVWIGRDVTILPSVKIGNGAIIATGAIVNKDVPDYAIVAGVPAKVIKYRFNEEHIDLLNKIKWWTWSDEEIKRNLHLFTKPKEFFRSISI